jgi:hypothetical protein
MPVVHVRGGSRDLEMAPTALGQIARAVSEATPCDLETVWCTFTALDVQSMGARTVGRAGRIVYVDVWIRPRADAAAATRALEAACRAAATAFEIPVEDVWGTLRPVEPLRVFAGGGLVED